jgi:hypothetical protein
VQEPPWQGSRAGTPFAGMNPQTPQMAHMAQIGQITQQQMQQMAQQMAQVRCDKGQSENEAGMSEAERRRELIAMLSTPLIRWWRCTGQHGRSDLRPLDPICDHLRPLDPALNTFLIAISVVSTTSAPRVPRGDQTRAAYTVLARVLRTSPFRSARAPA